MTSQTYQVHHMVESFSRFVWVVFKREPGAVAGVVRALKVGRRGGFLTKEAADAAATRLNAQAA